MSTQIGNGNITFGDGTIQTTKTPTAISAFTNDSVFVSKANVAATYATKANTVGSIYVYTESSNGYDSFSWNNINGTSLGSGFANCNCNC